MPGISTVLTVAQVCEALSISEPTLRRYAKSVPQFPRKVKLGPRRVGFIKGEVLAGEFQNGDKQLIDPRHGVAKRSKEIVLEGLGRGFVDTRYSIKDAVTGAKLYTMTANYKQSTLVGKFTDENGNEIAMRGGLVMVVKNLSDKLVCLATGTAAPSKSGATKKFPVRFHRPFIAVGYYYVSV